jgi:predicted HNH restriction endonuclease
VVDFLKSLGLSQLIPRLRLAELCPNCHQVMPLTGICDNCG